MDAHPEADGGSGLEDVASLIAVERMRRVRFAEDIYPARVRGRRLQHWPGHEIEVRRPVGCEFGRYDVGAEEGRLSREMPSNFECPDLIGHRQPIAAFDFYGGGAKGSQLGDPGGEQTRQLSVAGRARRCNRDAYAATVVGLADHPSRKLGASVPGEHQMTVRVDEARDDRPAADIDHGVGGRRLAG